LSALKSEFAQIKDEKLAKIAALSAGHEKLRGENLKKHKKNRIIFMFLFD